MKIFSFLRNNDDGASAVEFAIVLPLFLIFVFGIIEFGIIMYNKAMITNASREGARFGILYVDPPPKTQGEVDTLKSAVEAKVVDKLVTAENKSRLISLGNSSEVVDPTVTFSPDELTDREYIEVKVDYRYSFLILHLLWKLIPGLEEGAPGIDIGSTTIMRMEFQQT